MSSRPWRSVPALAALGVLVLPLALVTAGAGPAAAAPSCHGQPATLVGSSEGGYILTGTAGDDVIVTNGSTLIDAGAGDDLICITSDYGHVAGDFVNALKVDAGPGDDIVDVVPDPDGHYSEQTVVSLGTGADEFTTSSNGADETVYGAADGVPDTETDSIDTGTGADAVLVGGGGVLTDRVTMGPGASVLQVDASSMSPEALVQGASGVRLRFVGAVTGAYEVDGASGEVTRSGDTQPSFVWSGITDYDWDSQARVGFTGTDAAETFAAPHVVYADMGGGNDTVATGPSLGERRLDGGAGSDSVQLLSSSDKGAVHLDLADKEVRFSSGSPITSITGFEGYHLHAGRTVTFEGGSQADTVSAFACERVDLVGGSGADRLAVDSLQGFLLPRQTRCLNAEKTAVEVHGGQGGDQITDSIDAGRLDGGSGDDAVSGNEGNDVISGGSGDDVLKGGPGTDRVDGNSGRDTCSGEQKKRCER